ncbi:MAG: hypothetical protein IT361_13825 [Gemmatimonadaceae bacterium]|nr:hypothetical protein [Gemmatimonadaceae bacterium]
MVALATLAASPFAVEAQSGKWVGTIAQMSGGGAADISVEPRGGDKSRARITFRNAKGAIQLAWDIVAGSCRDEGAPVAPQPAFNQIQTQMDGGGSGTATIPKLESGKRYYVRVFDPQTAPTDAAAFGCANLSEKP